MSWQPCTFLDPIDRSVHHVADYARSSLSALSSNPSQSVFQAQSGDQERNGLAQPLVAHDYLKSEFTHKVSKIIYNIALSYNKEYLVWFACSGGSVNLYDFENGQYVTRRLTTPPLCKTMALSADSHMLAYVTLTK